jgi:hypothetical protein
LESEVEILKNQLMYQVTKNSQLFDLYKNLNETLIEMKQYSKGKNCECESKCKKNTDIVLINANTNKALTYDHSALNFSGEFIDSIINEENEKNHKVFIDDSPIKINLDNKLEEKINTCNSTSKVNYYERIINELNNKNIELTSQLEILKTQMTFKSLKINKLNTDKTIILNELNELLNALNRVDTTLLNKFYQANTKSSYDKKFNRTDIPSVLGIKYNILSAQTQIGFMLGPDKEEIPKNKIIKNQREENKEERQTDYLDSIIIRQRELFQTYQTEFENLLNQNLKKKRILESPDDE